MRLIKGDVALRPLRLDDAKPMAILANNKKIWLNVRNIFPHPYHHEDAVRFIKSTLKKSQDHVFAIEYEKNFCGAIGIHPQQDVYQNNLELGYWIGETFWNKAIATTAVYIITNFAFTELGFNRIYAGIFEYNIASMNVLEKNGFIKEGIGRKAVFKNGKYWDEHLYGKVQNVD